MKTVIQTAGSTLEKDWDGLPYYSMNTWLKQLFGTKAYISSFSLFPNFPIVFISTPF